MAADTSLQSNGVKMGSLNDHEWTLVSEGSANSDDNLSQSDRSVMLTVGGGLGEKSPPSGKVIVRPINLELNEIKSFRLSEDGNQLILIQNDGTKHHPLIFLDEGPEQLIEVFKR